MPAQMPARTYRVAAAGDERFETMNETIQALSVSVAAKLRARGTVQLGVQARTR